MFTYRSAFEFRARMRSIRRAGGTVRRSPIAHTIAHTYRVVMYGAGVTACVAFISAAIAICLCSRELCPVSRQSARWTLTALQIIESANSLCKNSAPLRPSLVHPAHARRRLPANSHPETTHSPPHFKRFSHESRNDVNTTIARADDVKITSGRLSAAHTIIKRISVNNNCDCLVVRARQVMAQLLGGLEPPPAPPVTPPICGERRILRWNGIQFHFVTVEWAPGLTCIQCRCKYQLCITRYNASRPVHAPLRNALIHTDTLECHIHYCNLIRRKFHKDYTAARMLR